jgi:predicted ATP-binding protein involved in virulence
MKINSLYIRNFRGFEEREFELNDHFTVAIGNNGLGKSTLLRALQVSLGAFLQSMPNLPANALYRRQFRPDERLVKFDPERRDFISNKELPMIVTKASWKDSDIAINKLEWTRAYMLSNSTTHNREHSNKITEYANFLYDNHGKNPNILYPVLANFQINRTNAQVKKVDKSWKRMSKISKGYYAALGENVDFTGVYAWLFSYDNCIKDGVEFEGTREAMFTAIKTAIPYIKEIDYNTKFDEFEVVVNFTKAENDTRMLASLLSDGMKAMLYMVAEIAYRCIMLNGKLGTKAVIKSQGIVLVDEIDMHLHPIWQKHVIRDLKDAFPEIQFVVTTHSPFIVQSIKTEELINLDLVVGLDEDPDKYSLEEVSEMEMGVQNVERSNEFLEMQKEAEAYFDLIKSGSSEAIISEAKEKLDRLRIKYNNNPAYVALLNAELPKIP